MRIQRILPAVVLGLLLTAAACVDDGTSSGTSSTAPEGEAAGFTPSEPIPNMHPLLAWASLRLGMSSYDISQAYNAPEGYGDGFTRVIQQFGLSANHVITFDRDEGEPLRTITCGFFRDELFIIVDRREGLSLEQSNEWFAQCRGKYGDDFTENVAGAQWSWGDPEDITAVFTQDNASDKYMTCNLVIKHHPTEKVWHAYNEEREERAEAKD